MWDLKVIKALNQVACELAKAGKNPAHAMSELRKRAAEKKSAQAKQSQTDGDNKE